MACGPPYEDHVIAHWPHEIAGQRQIRNIGMESGSPPGHACAARPRLAAFEDDLAILRRNDATPSGSPELQAAVPAWAISVIAAAEKGI
ncbi:hypothetical protein D9R08_04380 [Rhodophyticola porphyridii]|uniref:Uncharacterized protein n=1 Tax=Rhodophyticola porphyridii TaxID=1852017 RepID=A0A3L9Y5Z1_9RHOB|nr:hypothetical protein D9R08_04380 [Rhodophyticola porphyridii]